jgi:hypothetical protein
MMNTTISKVLAPLAAVVGFSLAITASSASAGPAWGSPTTLFEDDHVDFLIKGAGNTLAGIIQPGDLLASVLEFNDSAGSPIQPEELTGLAILEVAAILDLDGFGGLNDIVFQPATLGFDFYSGIAPLPNDTGAAGSGGMFALWLDGDPDLDVSGDSINTGSPSCTTYAGCVAQATDGDSWMIAGFGADPDNGWIAFNAYLDTSIVDVVNPSSTLSSSNAGLSVLFNNTGQVLAPNNIGCAPFCGPGGDGKVDMVAGLSIKGGGENSVSSEWFATSDLDMTLSNEPPVIGCRFTGGGVDTDLNWDGTLEDGSMRRGNGAGNLPDNIDRYQFGGQAGANTALPPQPKGEFTHHQQTGPSGSFTFHAGTASAPVNTEIDKITCTDPGFCQHARPAPAKQLDFEGVGTFKTVGKGKKAPVWGLDDQNQQVVLPFTVNVDVGRGNKGYNGTYHWFEANIDDLGEPRVENTTPIEACPTLGFGVNGDAADPLNGEPADCGCPDFYRIKIYNGVFADADGNITPNKAQLIYEAYGYVDGGNLQIHPLTGFDLN